MMQLYPTFVISYKSCDALTGLVALFPHLERLSFLSFHFVTESYSIVKIRSGVLFGKMFLISHSLAELDCPPLHPHSTPSSTLITVTALYWDSLLTCLPCLFVHKHLKHSNPIFHLYMFFSFHLWHSKYLLKVAFVFDSLLVLLIHH